MQKTVVVPLAHGFEEIEAITVIDVLRRAEIKVLVVAVGEEEIVEGGHGIFVLTEANITEIKHQNIDMIILPGGYGGTNILAHNDNVQNLIKELDKNQKLIGAICAAPMALDKARVLKGDFTCYPNIEKSIASSGFRDDKNVVSSENIITSRGPGTAIEFALEIVKRLLDNTIYENVKKGLLA